MTKTDNTMISNGIIIDDKFIPKINLQSGTLRIILTTKCNYNCKYCFAEGEKNKEIREIPIDKLKKIIKIAKEFGVDKIKLTGGEPLLYPYIEELLKYIKEIKIPYVDLTTNISLLTENNIKLLNKHNVNALTLSLNTLDKNKFEYLSNFYAFDIVKENLLNTISKFKGKIRINCIIFDDQYMEEDYNKIIKLCKENNIGIRIIEPSIVEGLEITYTKDKFYQFINQLKSQASKRIESDCKSIEYLFFDDWYLTIMHSLCDNRLCEVCPKYMYIRLTSDLKLKPCLSREDTEVPIDTTNNRTIEEAFIKAINYMGVGIQYENV